MVLYIKNMVCTRCKLVVQAELVKLGLSPVKVALGEAVVEEELSAEYLYLLNIALKRSGLEIIDDPKSILVEKIKKCILYLIEEPGPKPHINLSDHLTDQLHYNYTYLNNVFYKNKGISIEKYLIHLRIEKAKELLLYHEMNLTEISYQLNYSSVAHLSGQFKKITGMNPTAFKQQYQWERLAMDEV